MKLSARNQIKGRVTTVEKGQTTGHVHIDTGGGVTVHSPITNEAIDDLQLKVGDAARAVIKSSDVMVGKQAMRRRRWLAGLLLACLAALPALAQEPAAKPAPSLAIAGRVEHPRTVTLAELQAMPAATVEMDSTTSAGVQHAKYTGPLLWTLMQAAQPVDDPSGGNTALQHVMLARGQDGYAVALSIGEIDPRMEGKPVLVALTRDGQPMPYLRLVVPGDVHAARSVRDLASIEVR